jgi:hypothetical protein
VGESLLDFRPVSINDSIPIDITTIPFNRIVSRDSSYPSTSSNVIDWKKIQKEAMAFVKKLENHDNYLDDVDLLSLGINVRKLNKVSLSLDDDATVMLRSLSDVTVENLDHDVRAFRSSNDFLGDNCINKNTLYERPFYSNLTNVIRMARDVILISNPGTGKLTMIILISVYGICSC